VVSKALDEISLQAIKAYQAPVKPLWGRLFLDPAASITTLLSARMGVLRPAAFTLMAFALAGACAALFWHGTSTAFWVGAVLFQGSCVAERTSGLAAQLSPGSGSAGALIAAHTLAPWRIVVCALALSDATFRATGDATALLWLIPFASVCFLDATLTRIVIKMRGALTSLYKPQVSTTDHLLLRAKTRLEGMGLKLALFGSDEKGLLVLTLAPLVGLVSEALILAVALGAVFFAVRLRVDIAMLRDQLTNGTSHYLADSGFSPNPVLSPGTLES